MFYTKSLPYFCAESWRGGYQLETKSVQAWCLFELQKPQVVFAIVAKVQNILRTATIALLYFYAESRRGGYYEEHTLV